MLKIYQNPIIQQLRIREANDLNITLSIKREDLIHPQVSGNKWRKLIYNLHDAQEKGFSKLLTFGGAYSNHIYATAAAAKEAGFQSIGVIRGEELKDKPLNKTLSFAKECGMEFCFVNRQTYRNKSEENFISTLKGMFGEFYLIPEGGTNMNAIKGCEEILSSETEEYNYIITTVGTGGTITGIIAASRDNQKVIGISALKGDFLKKDVSKLLDTYGSKKTNWEIIKEYHFGGYAKTTEELISFIKQFYSAHQIPLDQVYTGKMMFAIIDLIKNGYFQKGSKILAIHTGGLQGQSDLLPLHRS